MNKTPIQGTQTVAAAGTPVQVLTTHMKVRAIELLGVKDRATDNVGLVYVGFKSGAGNQLRRIKAGEAITFSLPDHSFFDLFDLWLDAVTTGDGVVYTVLAV